MTMTVRWLLRAGALALAWCSVGCGGKNEPIPPLWVGPPQQSSAAEFADAYLVLTRADDSAPAWTIFDSGAPFSLFNARAFDRGVTSGVGEVTALSFDDVTLWRVPAYAVESEVGPEDMLSGHPVGGIVGYSAFSGLRLAFDPRARSVGFGSTPLPDGVDPDGTTLSFSVRGGGVVSSGFTSIKYPPSRIIVSAEIEARSVRLLLDTGASFVSLADDVFDDIAGDGRPLADTEVSTVSGSSGGKVMRVASMTALDQTTTRTLVLSSPALVDLLTHLETEVGEHIDGLLGHSFMQEFFTVVDYPADRVSIHRFTNRDFVLDAFNRVGFSIDQQGTSYTVQTVYPGTEAEAQGVSEGDQLVAIDGTSVSELGLVHTELALRGTVGTTRQIQFASATRVLPVEEILPTP